MDGTHSIRHDKNPNFKKTPENVNKHTCKLCGCKVNQWLIIKTLGLYMLFNSVRLEMGHLSKFNKK